MPVLRQVVGETLRGLRLRQRRTLREVSARARVSLGYLSEVERGRKEASSELLAAICGALAVSLSEVLREVSDDLAREERRLRLAPVGFAASGTSRIGVPMLPRPVAGIPPHHPARPMPEPQTRPVAPVASLSTSAPFGAIVAA